MEERHYVPSVGLYAIFCQLHEPMGKQVLIGEFLGHCCKGTCCHAIGLRREVCPSGKKRKKKKPREGVR